MDHDTFLRRMTALGMNPMGAYRIVGDALEHVEAGTLALCDRATGRVIATVRRDGRTEQAFLDAAASAFATAITVGALGEHLH